ncbi:hypothetical protein ACHQM5_023188 [Ranunculus cassubicifolius]
METPSSFKMVTRSQSKALINSGIPLSRKNEESDQKGVSRKRNVKMERSALFDITNDSPIVGLAMGCLKGGSFSTSLAKNKREEQGSPGSGEALLRGKVKILLQKESQDENPKLESEIQDKEMFIDVKQQVLESEKSDVTRALLFDFLEKSEFPSVLPEDDASVWSMQVNTSTQDEDEAEEEGEIESKEIEIPEEEDCYDDGEREFYEDEGLVDELCEGLSKMFVQAKPLPEFEGKHTRFVYNSDDEKIEGEEVVLHLKGLPAPQGKHLRFAVEE